MGTGSLFGDLFEKGATQVAKRVAPVVEKVIGPDVAAVFEHSPTGDVLSDTNVSLRKLFTSKEGLIRKAGPVGDVVANRFQLVEHEASQAEQAARVAKFQQFQTNPSNVPTKAEALFKAGKITKPEHVALEPAERRNIWNNTIKAHFGEHNEGFIAALDTMIQKRGLAYGKAVAETWDLINNETKTFPDWRREAHAVDTIIHPSQRYALLDVPRYPHASQIPEKLQWTSKDVTPQKMERAINGWMRFTMLGHIVLNHAEMPVLSLMRGGSAVDILNALNDSGNWREFLVYHGLFEDEYQHQAQAILEGRHWINKVFNMPGFSKLREKQIAFTGTIGIHAIKREAEELVASGGASKANRGFLLSVGINPDAVLERGGQLTEQELGRGAYNFAARDVMLKYSPLKTPPEWEHSMLARMATMYKSFQFREGKFFKDQFMRVYRDEGAKGVALQVAKFASIIPAMGFTTHALVNLSIGEPLLKNNDPTTIQGWLDDLSFAGGMGAGMTIVNSARSHAIANWLAGPFASTVGNFGAKGINMATGTGNDPYYQMWREVLRDFGGWPGRLYYGATMTQPGDSGSDGPLTRKDFERQHIQRRRSREVLQ